MSPTVPTEQVTFANEDCVIVYKAKASYSYLNFAYVCVLVRVKDMCASFLCEGFVCLQLSTLTK